MRLKTTHTDISRNPAEVFAGLLPWYDHCFLLETLADEDQPQTTGQSYIGVEPAHHYAAGGDDFYFDGKKRAASDPFEALRNTIDFRDRPLPYYAGGLVGYFSHEAMRYFEPTLACAYKRDFYDFQFAEYRDGLIFKRGQSPLYFHHGEDRRELYTGKTEHGKPLSIIFEGSAKDRSQYEKMVGRARDDIMNGRVFQAVLANRYDYRYDGDLFQLYLELRRINPSPFMFFMKFGDIITMGASPELLSHTTTSRRTYLEALAGTIQRGKSPAEDAMLAEKLLNDEKEIAEHSMLVDLVRNDIGRISRFGSVKIDKLMYLKKLSHVQHMCSLVSGQLQEGLDAFDALKAAFPAGTLVGAPKLEAAKMIAELEGYERGPYGGTVGYFSYNGDSMHAVNIRSLNAVGDKLTMHSGSGIVYDSQLEREFTEISNKKAAMDVAMAPFMKGLA